MVYRFDQFEVDDREFRLSEGGTPVQVEPKVLRLLVYLIENRSRLVRKQELLDAVWPDAMVTENALTRAIGLLRKALGEDSRVPRYLETIPTAGYRFIATVTVDEAASELAAAEPVMATTPLVPEKAALVTRRAVLWTAGAAAVSGVGIWLGRRLGHSAMPPAVYVTIELLEGQAVDVPGTELGAPVIAPDGSAIVVPLKTAEGTFLFTRRLDSAQLTRLEGTENCGYPFWSPDSQQVGFFADAKLKRIAAAGGNVRVLCDVADARGGTWGSKGAILFAPNHKGLFRVGDSGGDPVPVTQLDTALGENSHRFPVFLPDGERFLYFARTDDVDKRGIYLESFDRKRARRRVLTASSQFALCFEPQSAGYYLISSDGGRIVAYGFDMDRGEIGGSPQVLMNRGGWVSASDTGVLVVRSGSGGPPVLVWRDRSGKKLGQVGEPGDYWEVGLSPDGRYAAMQKHNSSGQFVLWVATLPEGLAEPFSDADHIESFVWSRDSTTLIYDDFRQNKLFHRRVSPKGPEEVHAGIPSQTAIQDITPDGRYLVAEIEKETTHTKVAWRELNGEQWQRVGTSPPNGLPSSFSGDGKWLAFASDRTGEAEIYVMDFPGGMETRRISAGGGTMPRWRGDGKELFYLAKDGSMMSVAMPGPALTSIGQAKVLFAANLLPHDGMGNQLYDVSADGQRFLIIERESSAGSSIEMVLNWPGLLPR
jgi:DNA-binding winged helix-turn-helix (wHTH) protein/Tol biopolymer transport system component